MSAVIQGLVNQPYQYGFVTDIEADVAPKGLSEDTIRLISGKKNEPEWLLELRLNAYRQWLKMEEQRTPAADARPALTLGRPTCDARL